MRWEKVLFFYNVEILGMFHWCIFWSLFNHYAMCEPHMLILRSSSCLIICPSFTHYPFANKKVVLVNRMKDLGDPKWTALVCVYCLFTSSSLILEGIDTRFRFACFLDFCHVAHAELWLILSIPLFVYSFPQNSNPWSYPEFSDEKSSSIQVLWSLSHIWSLLIHFQGLNMFSINVCVHKLL